MEIARVFVLDNISAENAAVGCMSDCEAAGEAKAPYIAQSRTSPTHTPLRTSITNGTYHLQKGQIAMGRFF